MLAHRGVRQSVPASQHDVHDLILVRHGESMHHRQKLAGGWTDATLTDLGRQQAHMTADFLKAEAPFPPAALLSSDLRRAVETASVIGAELGLVVETTPALRELSNGVAAGRPIEEIKRLQRPRSEPILDWVPFPEGESWRMMYQRVASCLSALSAGGRDSLVIVSHANSIVCIINWFLRLETDDALRDLMYEIRPCSITQLRRGDDGTRVVVRLNDTEHLARL